MGRQNSPLLYYVRVPDCDKDGNKVEWQWYRPHNRAYSVRGSQKLNKDGCANPGFVSGGSKRIAWSLYDDELEMEDPDDLGYVIIDEDILISWDIDDDEQDGMIPGEQYDELIEKLKVHMAKNN